MRLLKNSYEKVDRASDIKNISANWSTLEIAFSSSKLHPKTTKDELVQESENCFFFETFSPPIVEWPKKSLLSLLEIARGFSAVWNFGMLFSCVVFQIVHRKKKNLYCWSCFFSSSRLCSFSLAAAGTECVEEVYRCESNATVMWSLRTPLDVCAHFQNQTTKCNQIDCTTKCSTRDITATPSPRSIQSEKVISKWKKISFWSTFT